MQCIFCKQEIVSATRTEHIIPESLGGGEWAILPPGIVCDRCNQYFGSKVERSAIDDYPLNIIRLLNGVITKKRRWASMRHYLGLLEARPIARLIGIEPASPEVENAILEGRINKILIHSETRNPIALCRLLLKISLEVLAFHDPALALHENYDAARRFARAPLPGATWWFLYHGDPQEAGTAVSASIIDLDGGELALIELFNFTFFIPVSANIFPKDLDKLPIPEFRFFSVKA